jgi:hypothetical protein
VNPAACIAANLLTSAIVSSCIDASLSILPEKSAITLSRGSLLDASF